MKKLMLLSLVWLVSLSTYAQDLLSKIPKDAVFVGVLKGEKLLEQVPEEKLESYHITSKLFDEFKEMSSFKDMGIDLHQNFYQFVSVTDSIGYSCFLVPLQSADKFEKMAASLYEVVQVGEYKGIESRWGAIFWDQSVALYIFSFGEPTRRDYGMIDYERRAQMDEEVLVEVEETVENEEDTYEFVEESRPWEFDKYDVLEKVVTVLDDKENLLAGKAIFERNCTACHRRDGGGIVGPNHTDDYWLHGGSPSEIFHTIANGVPNKGMVSWRSSLSPKEIQQVMSYVRGLHGTTPKNAKKPQGAFYDRSKESKKMQKASLDEKVAFLMQDCQLTGIDRGEYRRGIRRFLEDLEYGPQAEVVEVEELETVETENETFVKPPLKVEKPKVTRSELIRVFGKNVLSDKSIQNSMAFNQSYLKNRNKKAVASAWIPSYGELYAHFFGLYDVPSYGYPGGLMGDMLRVYQKMKTSDIVGVKSLTANLFLKKNVAEMEVLAEMSDEMAGYTKQMSQQKFNKDFFRYFDGDKVMGYWGVAVNVENTIDGYPKMVSSILQKIMPEQKEEAALGAEFVSILLDAEEIGELINGDLMLVVSDVVEKEVKYMSYEYDDDFNATKVEKTKLESMPEFLMMMSTDKLGFFRKLMKVGTKYRTISQLGNSFYKLETKEFNLPMELYIVLKDDILFLASSEYQARDIANGKKMKMSRKHKRKAKNKNGIFYVNNDAILNAIPFDSLASREKVYLDYFHSNFKDMEISSYKIKNNVVKTKLSVRTTGAGKNALESFFGMIDQFFID